MFFLFKIESNEMDSDEVTRNHAISFNLDWLETAQPAALNTQIMFTQPTQTIKINDDQNPALMVYECPRCSLFESDMSNDDSGELQSLSLNTPLLDYIYRFWFVLRDATSNLDPCLIEGEVAARFLNSISPEKFYSQPSSAHQVYKLLMDKFNKKFLFTIESFKLKQSLDQTRTNEQIKTLYKIVDFEEVCRNT